MVYDLVLKGILWIVNTIHSIYTYKLTLEIVKYLFHSF